ncbi:unnamed protein product, partial [marine sediment metagenome]
PRIVEIIMVMAIKKEVKGCLKEKPRLSSPTTWARQLDDIHAIIQHKQYTTK